MKKPMIIKTAAASGALAILVAGGVVVVNLNDAPDSTVAAEEIKNRPTKDGIGDADLSQVPYSPPEEANATEEPASPSVEPSQDDPSTLTPPVAKPSQDPLDAGVVTADPIPPLAPNQVIEGDPAPPPVGEPDPVIPVAPDEVQYNTIYIESVLDLVSEKTVEKITGVEKINASTPFNGTAVYQTPQSEDDEETNTNKVRLTTYYFPADSKYLSEVLKIKANATDADGNKYFQAAEGETAEDGVVNQVGLQRVTYMGDYAVRTVLTAPGMDEEAWEKTIFEFNQEALKGITKLAPTPKPYYETHPGETAQPTPGQGPTLPPPGAGTSPDDEVDEDTASPKPTASPSPSQTPDTSNDDNKEDEEPGFFGSIANFFKNLF